MVIYKTINLINNKIYIGKDVYNRKFYLGSGFKLKIAIKKYGKNNFRKEIIEECSNKIELDEREIFWINHYNSTNPKIGYNITIGGTGGRTHNKEIYQYDLEGNFIKKWDSISECSQNLKLDVSSLIKACKGKIQRHGNFIWKYFFIEKVKKYEDKRMIKVYQYDLEGVFIKEWKSANEIQKKLNYHCGNICKALNGKYKTAYGFIWKKNKI